VGPLLDSVDPTGDYDAVVRPWLIPLDRIVSVSRLEGEVFVQRGALLVE
jgi:hypothetical protein